MPFLLGRFLSGCLAVLCPPLALAACPLGVGPLGSLEGGSLLSSLVLPLLVFVFSCSFLVPLFVLWPLDTPAWPCAFSLITLVV